MSNEQLELQALTSRETSQPAEPDKKSNPAADEPIVYTISDINSLIRENLESRFRNIWLRGEISNFKPHSSGHYYFSLKDEGAQINAVMFKGFNSKLKFKPENGLEVLVRGKITVYEPRGNYQIFCESMEPVGAGALQKAFEQLKHKLAAEGLFDEKRKRPLPLYPKHIGLVTSPTGAAIRDMLNVLRRRHRGVQITLAPAVVQGEAATASIVSAIELINKVSDIDVLIIGRGGGSIEDLWAFNTEPVARAIAASRLPTVSAVGHEIDFTIADFVADLRAPTPSAAAELVVKNTEELLRNTQQLKQRLWQALRTQFQIRRDKCQLLSKRLIDPQRKLQDIALRCDELVLRLEQSVFRYLEDRRRRVELYYQQIPRPTIWITRAQRRLQVAFLQLKNSTQKNLDQQKAHFKESVARLDMMSPLKVVERGYSIVEGQKDSRVITKATQVQKGESLKVRLASGQLKVEVKDIIL